MRARWRRIRTEIFTSGTWRRRGWLPTGFQGDGITGKCLVMITDDADRTMNTYLGITGTFGPAQLEPEVIGKSEYLYIEGYLVASDEGFDAALAAQAEARARKTRVSLTLSDPSIVAAFGDRMRALVSGGVDMLFCNVDEAQAFTETGDANGACAALETMVRRIRRHV